MIANNIIQDNSQIGIRIASGKSSIPNDPSLAVFFNQNPLKPAKILNNTIFSNGEHGIECLEGAIVLIQGNEIYRNGKNGVRVLSNSDTVDLGGGDINSTGNNLIYENTLYDLSNLTDKTIKAENCWWGTSPPEIPTELLF